MVVGVCVVAVSLQSSLFGPPTDCKIHYIFMFICSRGGVKYFKSCFGLSILHQSLLIATLLSSIVNIAFVAR